MYAYLHDASLSFCGMSSCMADTVKLASRILPARPPASPPIVYVYV